MFVVLETENGVAYFENTNLNKYKYVAVVCIEEVKRAAKADQDTSQDKRDEQEDINSEL